MADKSGWWVELTDGETTAEITRVKSVNPRTARNAPGDVVATVARDDSILEFARVNAELRLYRDEELAFRGFLHSADPDDENLTLRGPGIGELLDEDAPDAPVTYSNVATHDAIRDYLSAETTFSATVIEPDPQTIASKQSVQSASTTTEFTSIVSVPSDAPFVVNNGAVELAQSCFFFEGEDDFFRGASQVESSASGGKAEIYNSNGQSETTSFTLDHTIPSSDVGMAFRLRSPNNSAAEIDIFIDGTQATRLSDANWDTSYDWFVTSVGSRTGSLDASSHDVTLEVITSGDDVYVDCVAVFDDRFGYTFDNSTDANESLSGPELYPDAATLAFDIVTTESAISKGYLSVTDDNDAVSKLQLSFDDGTTYVPSDGSESGVDSITAEPSGATRRIRGRVTLTRYGSRSSPSPTSGFNGGSVSTWDMDVDLSDLSVIDELELTESDLSNIQTLHDYGDYTFIFDHEPDSKPIISYRYGQADSRVQKQLPGRVDEKDPRVNARNYANRVIVRGAEDSTDDRPEAIRQDDDAIANDPRVITLPPLYDNDITTEAGATFRAQALLRKAQRAGEVRGSVTLGLPHKAIAGYQFEVDFGNGPRYLTAEEVEIQDGDRETATRINFDRPTGLSQEIERLTAQKADASNS